MRRRRRNCAERLRFAVEALPRRTCEAMLRGIDSNSIVVGAYVDRDSGGICPMLAAHRNGGRTSLGSFARAWDRYTGAKRPRLATRRELRPLRSLLELSLAPDPTKSGSIAEAAAQIRSERAGIAARDVDDLRGHDDPPIRARRGTAAGERHRGRELRDRPRWSWTRPPRHYEEFRDLLAAAEEQLAEHPLSGLDGNRFASNPR